MPKQFWNIKNISNSEAELTIYGYIAMEESWWFDTVSSKKFARDLKDLGKKDKITVKINSGGGDVFAAHAIYNLLKDNEAKVTTIVEGLAASAASVILMAGDEIIVPDTGFVMIHNPSTIVMGEAKDFIKMAETLGVIKDGIVNAYVSKTGKTKKEISELMDEETWMTGEEAVKEGFADKINKDDILFSNVIMNEKMMIVNSISHNMASFKNFPIEKFKQNIVEATRAPENDNSLEPFNIPLETQNITQEVNAMNYEELKAAHPQLVIEIETAAKNEGIKQERERFKAIDEISTGISAELVKNAKYENPVSAETLAFNAVKENQKKSVQYMVNRTDETDKGGAEEVKPDATTTLGDVDTDKVEEAAAVDNIANAANQRRAK